MSEQEYKRDITIPYRKAGGIYRELVLCLKDMQDKLQEDIKNKDWSSAHTHADRLCDLAGCIAYLAEHLPLFEQITTTVY